MNPRLKQLLYILAFIKLVIPFFLQHSSFQPHRDEFLYLAEGRHMAWGYMEVPPLLSVFAWLTNALGAGMFWIKIWPALFGTFTFLLVGRLVLSLGGKAFALLLAWFPFMLDGYMRLFFLFQPNYLEVFFWTALAFSLARYLQTKKNNWLYILGACAGLGLMSKYSVAFFILSLLAGLLLTAERKIFLNRHLYYSAGIALLIFLPNILWQYNHGFPVVTHMDELQEQQLQYINPVDFIISQLLMNLPCIYIWVSGLLFVLFSAKGKLYRAVGWGYLLVILLLVVLHGKDYYALGAYPVLFAFGAVTVERITAGRWRWTRYALSIFSIALGLFSMPLIMPVASPEKLVAYYEKTGLSKTGSFKWEDLQYHSLPQDFADMIGWKEMAQKAAKVYHNLPQQVRDSTMIYCRAYSSAGSLNFYRKEAGLPEVYSDNASFLLWMPEHYHIRHLLLVSHNMPEKGDIVFEQFEKRTIIDSVNMPLFRETGMKFTLFENGNDSVNRLIEKSIAEQKAKFTR